MDVVGGDDEKRSLKPYKDDKELEGFFGHKEFELVFFRLVVVVLPLLKGGNK